MGLRSGLCAGCSSSSNLQPGQTISLWTSFYAQKHYYAGTYLDPWIPVKTYYTTVCFQHRNNSFGKTHIWLWWTHQYLFKPFSSFNVMDYTSDQPTLSHIIAIMCTRFVFIPDQFVYSHPRFSASLCFASVVFKCVSTQYLFHSHISYLLVLV